MSSMLPNRINQVQESFHFDVEVGACQSYFKSSLQKGLTLTSLLSAIRHKC